MISLTKFAYVILLKLATRAKFHLRTAYMMEMIIALDSSFRKVQFWYKDHLILISRSRILNLFSHEQIVKVALSQMEAQEAQWMCLFILNELFK